MEDDVLHPGIEVSSLTNFLEEVTKRFAGIDHVLFRGHQDSRWSLTPRIARLNLRLRFEDFRLNAERSILEEFERLAAPHLAARGITTKWDLLALAQHQGLPTRLLDWSTNPLVALWFAVEKPALEGSSAAVWAFPASEKDIVDQAKLPDDLDRTMIFRPRHHDSRIAAQAGWFTVHKYSESARRYSKFERLRRQHVYLTKFIIPSKGLPEIRDQLARCGVSRSTLFPDLAGLCAHLTWKYEKLSDEDGYDLRMSL